MITLIAGTSHTGKTCLAQRLLEKHGWPCLSLDLAERIRDNAANLAKCREHDCEVILIDGEYQVDLPN